MTTQPAAIPSVAHLPSDGDIVVTVAFRPTDPIGMTFIDIENGDHLTLDERLHLLTEVGTRVHVHAADLRASALYEQQGLIGYRLNGWPCCTACFLTGYALDADGVAHVRGVGEPITDVRPIRDLHPTYQQRITCTVCDQARPWVPRVIEGGRS